MCHRAAAGPGPSGPAGAVGAGFVRPPQTQPWGPETDIRVCGAEQASGTVADTARR